MMLDDERRTVDELRTIYELYPDIREVFVEGREDALFISAFLRHVGCDALVHAVDDRVRIPAGDVIAAGLENGARGRVATLALLAYEWPEAPARCVTCLIDADRSHYVRDLPSIPNLLVSDYGSLEAYCLDELVLEKFVSVVLRIDIEFSTDELLAIIKHALVLVFAVRCVLHLEGTGCSLWSRFHQACDLSAAPPVVDIRRILNLSCDGLSHLEIDQLEERAVAIASELDPSDRRFVRGHDIAPLLSNMLQLKNDWAHSETVERALMGCIEFATISDEAMFVSLRSRVCG